MMIGERSLGGSLVVEDLLEFGEQFGEGLGDEVRASGVVVGEVVGGLPLPDHVVGGGGGGGGVVVEDPALHQQVPEANTAPEATQVHHFHIVPAEEVEQLAGLGVVDGEHFLPQHGRVVGAVGDGARVKVAVESAVTHRYVILLYKIIQRKVQQQSTIHIPSIHAFFSKFSYGLAFGVAATRQRPRWPACCSRGLLSFLFFACLGPGWLVACLQALPAQNLYTISKKIVFGYFILAFSSQTGDYGLMGSRVLSYYRLKPSIFF